MISKRWRGRIRSFLENIPFVGPWAIWFYRRQYRAPRFGYPPWEVLLKGDKPKWNSLLSLAGGPRVLVATSVGAYLPGNTLESVLAAALTLRGARVSVFLCDGVLPACFDAHNQWYKSPRSFLKKGPQGRLCASCYPLSRNMYETLGFPVEQLGQWIRPQDREDLATLLAQKSDTELSVHSDQGMAVGEHALAGALRYFARATLEPGEAAKGVFRKYFEAAFLTARGVRRLLQEKKIDRVVLNHGLYVPQGLVGEAARSLRIPVANWNPAYRKKCFIFSHEHTYHHTLMNEPTGNWENLQLTPTQDEALGKYLNSRRHGTQDWIWFHESPRFSEEDIRRSVGADPSKPWIGLLTNVLWDAQLHYPANAFPNLLEWLFFTVDYFERRPELQLIVRVHPAEIRGTLPSRQRIIEEFRLRGKKIPSNVFLVGPESPVSTYALMDRCNAVLIYGTKTGVELTSAGIPVIVAGEAWVRGKGFTQDAGSPEHYAKLMDRLPFEKPMSQEQVQRARRYAYHFFFRRMIPLEFMEPRVGDPPYGLSPSFRLGDLQPGKSKGLDVICNGILTGAPFVFPMETLEEDAAHPSPALSR